MDLALNLGKSVAEMSRDMTERELGLWAVYARQKGLPSRRLEIMLGVLTLWTTRVWGSKEYTLDDFMLDHRREWKQDTADTGVRAINMVAGGRKVIRLGQGRKRG